MKTNANLFGDQGNGGLGYNVYNYPQGQMLIGLNGKLNPEATLGRIENYKGKDYLLTPDDWEKQEHVPDYVKNIIWLLAEVMKILILCISWLFG